ncbi:hypothetical protein [Streptomyces canus]|uniref:hypothetical protein n=1 Tax=Streptomyces canus TaxID=58343 RepID=UPI00386321DA|nr:hypothetical protein OH824_23850 [Streptomyces canus]
MPRELIRWTARRSDQIAACLEDLEHEYVTAVDDDGELKFLPVVSERARAKLNQMAARKTRPPKRKTRSRSCARSGSSARSAPQRWPSTSSTPSWSTPARIRRQQIDDSLPRGYLAGDRAYNNQKPENFQLPIRAMGYEPVYDYAKDQLGVQAGFAGAELIEGNWYCPSMPEELKEATKDLINEKIDKQTWINRIRARAAYLFMPKQRPDAEGHRRVMCPAEANRTQCPLKAYTLGRGIHLPLVDPDPSPAGSPPCCSQKTVTVPPEAGAGLWQPLQYGSEAWQRVYFRLRNSVEGINGYAKDTLRERLEDAGTCRIRGIAAPTLLLAFQLAHANRRKLRAWADSITLHDDRPRRRPTRRRKTKPLGTWTPKGCVNEP